MEMIDQISHSTVQDDQKLLQYRKLMTLAADKEAKLQVIDRLGDFKTFIALVYASKFLDDKELKFRAASAVMQIALPESGKMTGLAGEIIKIALTKSSPLIKGTNNKEKIRKYLASMPDEKGYVPMFNGKDLTGWTGNTVDYEVKNGEIVLNIDNGPSHGNLFTQGEYRDFIYRFEFQLTPGANNGLGIRAPLEGDAAYVGMELQILDDDALIYAQFQPYQYHGSVYGVMPAKRGSLKPTGQWNYEEVIVKGNNVKVILNGNVITDGDIQKASRNGTMDHRDHPGLNRATGHIGFLGHGSVVKFRNIRIKEL